jgi:hypothetical protein
MFWFVCRYRQKGQECLGVPSDGAPSKASLTLVAWTLIGLERSKGSSRAPCDAMYRAWQRGQI